MYIQYNTHTPLSYEWDPVKREKTIVSRAIDFARAVGIFDAPTLEYRDQRRYYGEVRTIAIGRMEDGRLVTVVYTDRANLGPLLVRRIISARRSNRRERQAYQDAGLPG